ncbi:hypothetical protein Tco_0894508 [Tanacetum coccineum]|uniref:Uncharacterized protein n=1 Tax=Tanacetum coccineum TaxID=301880 RepID=A0ABQ5CF78_9ASTR
MPTPPPSPHISLSPPSAGERFARCTAPPTLSSPPPVLAPLLPSSWYPTQIQTLSSPPHVLSPLLPSSWYPTQIQTLRISSTQALVDAVTTALPSPPLPPSLYIPPPVDRRDDIPEFEQPPRKRLSLSTLGSSEVRYGIRDTWVDPEEAILEVAPMTVEEVSTRVTELAELHKRDIRDLYALLEDAQDGRTRISQRVAMDSQRVDLRKPIFPKGLGLTYKRLEFQMHANAELAALQRDLIVRRHTRWQSLSSHQRYEARDELACRPEFVITARASEES